MRTEGRRTDENLGVDPGMPVHDLSRHAEGLIALLGCAEDDLDFVCWIVLDEGRLEVLEQVAVQASDRPKDRHGRRRRW